MLGRMPSLAPSLAIVSRADTTAWVALFRAALPGHEIFGTLDAAAGRPLDYVVVGRPPPGTLAGLTGLKAIFSLNAGVEHLLADPTLPPVPLVRLVDDGLEEGMTEWVVAQVLAWHRNLAAYRRQSEAGVWKPLKERLARERTVTVLGAGRLGGAAAAALASLNFKVRTWSRTPKSIPGVTDMAGEGRLLEAVEGADVLVDLLPLTSETADLVGAAVFARLAPGALFVNAARGGHVVDADLVAALDAGLLGAAVLDVFREEPLPSSHPFWAHPGITVSPHVASVTHASTAVAAMADNIRRFEAGGTLAHVVDPARGY